jgi:hypothetical protein
MLKIMESIWSSLIFRRRMDAYNMRRIGRQPLIKLKELEML